MEINKIEKKKYQKKYKNLSVVEYNKIYYQLNYEHVNFLYAERHTCECGSEISYGSISKHKIRKCHIKKIEMLNKSSNIFEPI